MLLEVCTRPISRVFTNRREGIRAVAFSPTATSWLPAAGFMFAGRIKVVTASAPPLFAVASLQC